MKNKDAKINDKNEINSKFKNNNQINEKIQFSILKESKKLKISLEINDKNNSKLIYSNSFSLNDLIKFNNFFENFKDYSEAFEYLINNYTKIDKTKIKYINNNKEINILLPFSIIEDNNIFEDNIEIYLHNNNINLNKSISNIIPIINALKKTLEKFNLSIKELKSNIDKDKIEKEKKIKELENNFNLKLNEIKNINELKDKNKIEKILNEKTNEIFLKIEEYNKEINKINKIIKEGKVKYNNELSKNNNNIFPEKHNEFLNKIISLEEKTKNIELNLNNIINNSNNILNENIKNKKIEVDNLNMPNNLENIIKEKINKELENKMSIFEEKLQILNSKVINLEIRNQNKGYDKSKNEESFMKDISFNDSIFYDKIDKKIQNINNNLNNKLQKFAKRLNISLKDIELDKSLNNNIIEEKNNELINNEKNNDKMKIMNSEIDIKIKNIENKSKEIINIKIQDIKKEIYSVLNKINDRGKEDYKDLNNKILISRNELVKSIDSKNNKIIKDNQIYLEKMNYFEIKIKNIDNKIKQIDNKLEIKNKNTDIISNNNLNNSYIIPNTKNILYSNNNSNDENDNQKNKSFNYSSNIKGKINEKIVEIDSNILNNEYKSADFILFSKIREIYNYNRFIKYTLIYRVTKDGDSAKNFHLKCDFIGPNIIIVKTKKGYIFGGFTTKSWKHLFKDIKKDDPEYGTEIKDEKAFGFSLNENKIYINGKPNENIIYCNNNYGPIFKNNFFKIYDECLKNGGLCGKIEESNFIGQEKEYEINGGEEKIDVEELEIFQIGFK